MKLDMLILASLLALAACGGTSHSTPVVTPPVPAGPASAAPGGAVPDGGPAARTTPPLPAPPAQTGASCTSCIDRLAGAWAGQGSSPFGDIPFALVFDYQADGSLHAHSELPSGLYVDLRIHQQDGAWLLTEEAFIPAMGKQRYTLVPVTLTGDSLVWQHAERPGFLQVRCDFASADAMRLVVHLRGEEHVAFAMQRLRGEAAEELRRELEAMRAGHPG